MKVLIQLCDASSDPKIRVRCIGTLECLAQYPESIEGNRVRNTDIFAIIPLANDILPFSAHCRLPAVHSSDIHYAFSIRNRTPRSSPLCTYRYIF